MGKHVRGQALVELLVALLAVVPLYLAIALLAKYQDMQQATIAASRTLAFECTVRRDPCADVDAHPELADEVRRRYFGRLGRDLVTLDPSPGVVDANNGNPFWVDRSNRPLLERFDDVSVAVTRPRFSSPLAFAGSLGERSFPGAVRVLSELGGPGRFGLEIADGLIEAQVQARVARTRDADGWITRLAAMPLTLQARTAVLTDAWNASEPYGPAPDSVQTRVEAGAELPLVDPAIDAGYLPIRGLLGIAGLLGFESRAREFRYHEIDVDLVPADRLPSLDVPPGSTGASAGDANPNANP